MIFTGNQDEEPSDLPLEERDQATKVKQDHNLYLKAINNPVRRRILELVLRSARSSLEVAAELKKEGLLPDEAALKYHLDFLLKAACIEVIRDEENKIVRIRITRVGEVVDYLEK